MHRPTLTNTTSPFPFSVLRNTFTVKNYLSNYISADTILLLRSIQVHSDWNEWRSNRRRRERERECTGEERLRRRRKVWESHMTVVLSGQEVYRERQSVHEPYQSTGCHACQRCHSCGNQRDGKKKLLRIRLDMCLFPLAKLKLQEREREIPRFHPQGVSEGERVSTQSASNLLFFTENKMLLGWKSALNTWKQEES